MAEEGLNWLYEILQDVQLSQFLASIRDDLQITRLEHFDYVKPEDLEKVGLSKPGNCNNCNYTFLPSFTVWVFHVSSQN